MYELCFSIALSCPLTFQDTVVYYSSKWIEFVDYILVVRT